MKTTFEQTYLWKKISKADEELVQLEYQIYVIQQELELLYKLQSELENK